MIDVCCSKAKIVCYTIRGDEQVKSEEVVLGVIVV